MPPTPRDATDDLQVSSSPVEPVDRAETRADVVADVAVAALSGFDEPAATALASMRRPGHGEPDEVWAQLFVDGVFLDVARTAPIDSGGDAGEETLVARFSIPAQYLDGATHRLRVCFVTAVSRVVPRGEGLAAMSDLAPEAIAEADFTVI